MDKIIALTRQQRETILQHLTANQVQALSEFTRYAMLSRFHTHHYLKQTDWEFQGMVIDPWYQRQHDHPGDNLYCDCGRRLKNQFILRSRTSGRQLFLGISHFQQHASIPQKVAREIQAGINEINLYMDSILLAYQSGYRFPQKKFQFVVDHQGFKNHEGTILCQRCNLFSQVNLPLHQRDYQDLQTIYYQLKQGVTHRLTKQEINQLRTIGGRLTNKLRCLTISFVSMDSLIKIFTGLKVIQLIMLYNDERHGSLLVIINSY